MTEPKREFYFFIGTIAELIKVFTVMQEMEKRNISYKIISTEQHKIEQSDIFKILKKQKIDIYLNNNNKIKKNTLGLFAWFLETTIQGFKIFKSFFPNSKAERYLIIHGDTLSTLIGSILGRIFHFKVCHIESGLRSFNIFQPFPEEIDRIIASKFVDTHFPPNKWAESNLNREGGIKICTYNNTLIDSLVFALSRKIKSVFLEKMNNEPFCVFVVHRQENVINKRLLEEVIVNISEVSKNRKVLFILHEITKSALIKFNLLKKLELVDNITLVNRLPYFELMHILKKAEFIVTDGGSNQEECYYLGLPTLILRNYSERKEGLGHNAILYKSDFGKIGEFCSNFKNFKRDPVFEKEFKSPSKIIVDYLIK